MISKEEFLKLAAAEYEKIEELENEESFYEYEKSFESIWINYGRKVLERSISKEEENNRKKKS